MARSTHHPNYQTLLALLRDLRERAGVTQLALAESLGNTQTFISKVERGERRIDVVEFIEICEALGTEPIAAFSEYLQRRSVLAKRLNKLARRTPS
jgi:transcriptional regulator with XRE-family HTH domain